MSVSALALLTLEKANPSKPSKGICSDSKSSLHFVASANVT
jgi:hypothetical protein